jgi:hypothetical protein
MTNSNECWHDWGEWEEIIFFGRVKAGDWRQRKCKKCGIYQRTILKDNINDK